MVDEPRQPNKLKDEDIVMDLVQGKMPGSINEYILSLAFDKLGIDYSFQHPLGPIGIRGSQVIDFIAYVAPAAKACFMQGGYWHDIRSEGEDILKHSVAEKYYGAGNVVDFFEEETQDVASAVQAIRKKVF